MAVFKCKMCGGTLEFNEGDTVAVCDSCGTKQTLPKLDDDKKANMFDRANHFRRNNDYDKAMGIYEQILNEDSTDAESYWSLVLCRYGIEYVEDPATHKRVPTINRAQFTSIFDDEDYKSAIEHADTLQKQIYMDEANAINEIQKGILDISKKEEPFDVFICYKETDADGRRTQDSVLATDLYHQLTQEGFKVFFSRITLEDKLGTAYEPYIFAALNSAKVMVVLGTKPEYFNAIWVKNEWGRYLALIKNDPKKTLIPAFRDMDPYDLPDEFSHLQAQDMGKLGFMQDLIRGIKKILDADREKQTVKETIAIPNEIPANTNIVNTAPLLERVHMFLEDGEWQSAKEYCEKVLDQEPKNTKAYIGLICAENQASTVSALKGKYISLKENKNYDKAIRFGTEEETTELKKIEEYNSKLVEGKRRIEREQQQRIEAAEKAKRLIKEKEQEAELKKQLEIEYEKKLENRQWRLESLEKKLKNLNNPFKGWPLFLTIWAIADIVTGTLLAFISSHIKYSFFGPIGHIFIGVTTILFMVAALIIYFRKKNHPSEKRKEKIRNVEKQKEEVEREIEIYKNEQKYVSNT